MLTRLCLVRHGETAWNAERRLQGHTDIPLNAHGLAQAQATAASLAGERFDAAYSSDLARARQTAEAIAGRCRLTPAFDDRLRERHYGAFQSLTYDEARARYPDAYHRFETRDSQLDFARVDAPALAAGFERGLRAALEADPPPPAPQWMADLADLPQWIARIRQRGGDVIFYTPPVSGAQDTLAEAAFPRTTYWNPLMARLGVHALIGNDIPALRAIPLPDTSHMDAHDKPAYTRALLQTLIDHGALRIRLESGTHQKQ